MSALPVSASESAVRAAIERLSRVQPGAYHVVSCYLKLEPRDKTRGKYLIKIKNRIREALAALQRQELERVLRAQVAADLERVQAYFGEPTRLPSARVTALFACGALDLFEAPPLPHVHRSRLAVAPVPLPCCRTCTPPSPTSCSGCCACTPSASRRQGSTKRCSPCAKSGSAPESVRTPRPRVRASAPAGR